MSLISRLTPTNLQIEKEKFLADTSYNPQFEYENTFDQETLQKYGHVKNWYLEKAKQIVEESFSAGQTESDLVAEEGGFVTHAEVDTTTKHYLRAHNLQDIYSIVWSASFISRATISKHQIRYRTTATFRSDDLIGMLNHEIGTHAIRRFNQHNQIWNGKKKKYGFKSYLKTEEGMAVLHALLALKNKRPYKAAIRYLAVNFAREHSFAELWDFVGNYIQDQETRWMVTIRQKRGLTDTSQPGGFTKDLVYFEGFVDICRWLVEHNFDMRGLYYGKIHMDDVAKARDFNPNYEPLLPIFYSRDPEKYADSVRTIMETNGISL